MTLKWEASAFKNPMSRARGLGSLHEGAHHWMAQRVTALSNFALMLWAICSVAMLAQGTYADMQAWISTFPNPVLMALLVLSSFYHAALGLQVVVEDYVHCTLSRLLTLTAIRFALFAGAAGAIFSILKLAL